MGKAQTVKQARLQRKILSNMVQATIPIAAVQQYTKVDPPPDSTPFHSPLSQPAYMSFSELYYNDVPSLASSSVETLLSSSEPMDWDRETLFDPASFRDSFYAAPHEDDLPIPGKGFFFNTPSIVEPSALYLDSSMSLFEQELVSMLTEELKPFNPHPLPDEDIAMDALSVELENKLILEPMVVGIEIDLASPVITPPSEIILPCQLSLPPPQGCVRTSRHSRTIRFTPYTPSKSLVKRRAITTQDQLCEDIKEPTRTFSSAKFISTILRIPRTIAEELLLHDDPCPSPMLDSRAGAIRRMRRPYRNQYAFSCWRDSEVYEPSLEAVLGAIHDFKQHEDEQYPIMDLDGEAAKKSKFRKLLAKGTSWIKKSAKRVHKELKRRRQHFNFILAA